MGHHSKDRKKKDCAPCRKGGEKRVEKKHVEVQKQCGICPDPICDCRTPKCKDPEPLKVIEATLTPSVEPGTIAEARIDLSDNPLYRPHFNVCDRREVVVHVTARVVGGTVAQAIYLDAGVFYDSGVNDIFSFGKSEPLIVLPGVTLNLNLKVKADLDKDRIISVKLLYLTGVTPPVGAGVTYIPPASPLTPDVIVSIYPSREYPTLQDKHHKLVVELDGYTL
jgi:hypothetical protein